MKGQLALHSLEGLHLITGGGGAVVDGRRTLSTTVTPGVHNLVCSLSKKKHFG